MGRGGRRGEEEKRGGEEEREGGEEGVGEGVKPCIHHYISRNKKVSRKPVLIWRRAWGGW